MEHDKNREGDTIKPSWCSKDSIGMLFSPWNQILIRHSSFLYNSSVMFLFICSSIPLLYKWSYRTTMRIFFFTSEMHFLVYACSPFSSHFIAISQSDSELKLDNQDSREQKSTCSHVSDSMFELFETRELLESDLEGFLLYHSMQFPMCS